jgi:hypothetical protein
MLKTMVFWGIATGMFSLVIALIIWAMRHVRPQSVAPVSPPVIALEEGDDNDSHQLSLADREYVGGWEKNSPMYTRLYWVFVGIIFLFFLAGGIFLVGYIFTIDFSKIGNETWEKVLFLVLALGVYLGLAVPILRGCIQKVEPDETALLKVLGLPIKVCDPGPVVIFFGGNVMSLQREKTPTNQKQYPAETENITYADAGAEPEGKKQLLRATLLGPEGSVPGDDPWKQRRTIGIGFTLSLMPDTNHPFTFFRFTGTIEQAQEWGSDVVLSKYVRLLAGETLESLPRNLDEIGRKLKREVEKVLNPRGVTVVRVELLLIDYGRKFNENIQLEADALLVEKGALVDARKAKKVAILDGEAKQAVEQMLYDARVYGYKKIADTLGMEEKEIILMVDAMKNVLEKSNNTVLLGSNGVSELIAGAQTLLKGMNIKS